MRWPSRCVLLFVGSVCLAAYSADLRSQQPASASKGAISGVVIDATSQRPVAGAVVSLRRGDGKEQLPRMVTDARGRFVFADLAPAGDYYLEATGNGFAFTRVGWTVPNQSRAPENIRRIAVADGQWVRDIAVQMWRLGVITGRVIDERSEPVVGVVVQAFGIAKIAGQSQPVGGPIGRTDDRGAYRLTGLPPGRYVVSVMSVQSTMLDSRPGPKYVNGSGYAGTSDEVSVATAGIDVDGRHRRVLTSFATPPPPTSSASRVYPATFFPAATSATDAAPIEIGYGESRVGIDVQLQPVPAVRVSGRLSPDTGVTPPPTLVLRLMARGQEMLGFGAEIATTLVEPDGTFTFLSVPAGDYTLLAQSSVMEFVTGGASARMPPSLGFPMGSASMGTKPGTPGLFSYSLSGPARPAWGRVGVSVGNRDVADLVVMLHPTSVIRGRLVFAEGVTPPASLTVSAEPVNGDPSLGNPFARAQVEQSPAGSGPFTIQGLLSGIYQLTFVNFAPLSVVSAGRDVKDMGFDGSQGRDFNDVVVTLTNKFAQIAGVVRDDRGPATGAVIAFPVERERWTGYGWTPARLFSVSAGSDGTYRLDRLPEGEYFVVAVDVAHANAWVDPAFLAAAAAHATRISVKWGEQRQTDLKIERGTIK